uniref:Uncharacterized protein n=1 Tax=Cacopsylla melanoneura TaxID=428564 RepID=A0A8D8U1H0_9HEMI
MMEILRSAGERGTTGGIPAHHHNVEEWSNLDPFSGIREQKRVETDHWANNTRNSSHQYGKVVDSRARNLADGTREQMKQMKQLEVFQARVPGGGSVQVIRSHTSTTSSKISGHSWTNSSKMIDTSTPSFEPSSDFDNLKLSIMPLNLNTERTKVNLGRSGSLNKRRPPTRPRSLLCSNDEPSETIINTTASIPLEEPPKVSKPSKPVSAPKLRLAELATNADRIGTRYTTPTVKSIKSEMSKSSKTNVEKPVPSSTPYKSPTIVRNESLKSPKIFRSLITKRTTPAGGIDSSSDNEHRPLEAKKSVSSEDVSQDYGQDGGQGLDRSSAARRSLNLHKDYHWSSQHTNELENVFKKVLKNKTFYNRTDFDDDDNPPDERTQPLTTTKKSFVSAETIKNIRNNLKPVEDGVAKVAEVDVSIRSQGVMKNGDTVASGFNGEAAHVNNYNTGSLENKQNRNEEWYNRRKSYGFEQMKDLSDTHHTTGNSLKHIESSTDSGIAKSNEHIDSLLKKGMANPANDMFEVRRNSLSKNSKIYSTLMSLRDSNKKSDLENSATFSNTPITVDQFGDNRVNAGRELLNTPESNGVSKTLKEAQNEPVCITIKPKEEYTSVINIPNKNEMKVESTMVEDGEYFRKVKEIYDKGAWVENGDNKKPKKVEFSKTEVHFEPGKVNIIETNEKPPPTNYRRRRKERLAEKQAERTEKSQAERPREKIPEIKFGDEIEKPVIALPYEPKVHEPIPHEEPVETNIEIVVDESEEDSKKPKSILKSAKIDETTNENIDQTKTDFKKILNSFKTSERQNSTGSPPVVDNGLKVRITSGNNQFDQRRASWCVPDNSNKFSTKINFGADNITILPQKTRYSYCEPSTRTIQSICSQSTNGQDDSPNVVTNNPLVSYTAPAVSSNHPSSSDEYSRFRTKSPLTNISKTTILNTNPLGSTSFFVNKQEIVMKSLSDNRHLENVPNRHSENVSRHLESVPRRNPEKSNEMSAILNRYSYTETSKSPIMSEQPTRFSYSEPANSSSEPIWYQHERQAKNQFSSTAITASNPTNKKEPLNDPPQVTSIALHYEPAKPKTFQPVCLIYKPESPTSKRIHDYENHKTETRNGTEEIRTHHKEKTAVVTTHIRQEKRSNRESNENIQKAQANKITNELKKINESIKLSSGKHLVNATRKTEKTLKEEPPKRPARKVKEEPIYEKIQYRSKKNSEVGKNDSLRLKNTKDQFSSRSSGRDSWLNIPKENGHCSRNTSKEVKPRSRDSSLESNHTLTNRSRTSSMSSNIRSRTSSLESNSQLHSAVLLKSRNGSNESGQRSRTSSIDSNRSTNLRNVSRNHSNTPTPVRSRTSSMESDRSYQGVTTRSRLTTTQNRHFTTSKTREHSKSSPITENKRCTKQLLESANKGVCLNEVSRKSKQYPARSVPSRSRQSSADSTIMEELTKAADEILLAVNGYTDEDSIRGSDDERNKKKSYKPLTTIVETPNRSVHSSRNPRKSDAPVVVRENIYSNVKSQRRSSNSSLETNEKPNSRTVKTSRVQENVYANIKPVKKSETGEKVKKKTSRMQRTSSREILESSSDDNSRDEIIKNKKMVRRSKVKTGNTITTNNVEVCTNKKLDKTVTPSKPRSSSVIRSVANHIIESVSPAPSSNDKDKHSTEKKTCLKTALFSKQSTNGTKASKRQESRGSSQSQKVSSMKSSSSSAKKK